MKYHGNRRVGGERIGASPRGHALILVPLFNDWASFAELAARLDAVLAACGRSADILVVDDASTADPALTDRLPPLRAIGRVDVLALRRNLGHQRAIAVGLAYVEDTLPAYSAVVVMDSDGEDDPADVPRLLDRLEAEGGRAIVFAERAKRSESPLFRAFYALYKAAHRVLTGQGVRVGNFSAIPRRRLASLAAVSEMWNHYAAAAFRSKQPCCTVPTRRAKRLRGRSTMNFVGLVTHGLSAISVYSDVVGVRLMVVSVGVALLGILCLAATIAVRLTTSLAIPGWATYTAGLLSIVILQSLMLACTFSFVVLSNRNGMTFLPRRDYHHFVAEVRAYDAAWASSPTSYEAARDVVH